MNIRHQIGSVLALSTVATFAFNTWWILISALCCCAYFYVMSFREKAHGMGMGYRGGVDTGIVDDYAGYKSETQ